MIEYYVNEGEFPESIQKRLEASSIKCGAAIGKGWLPMVVELDNILSRTDPDYTIAQIKEKFGELRFYVDGVTSEEGYDAINNAEHKSTSICEICGEEGKTVNKNGWYVTRCLSHENS